MQRRKWIVVNGMLVLAAILLVLSVATAEGDEKPKNACTKMDKCAKSKRCKLLMGAALYLDGPAVIAGQTEMLGLSDEQIKELKKIQDEARKKALAVLTPEQSEKLGKISDKPISLAQLCEKICPITDDKSRACAVSPAKAACAVSTEAAAEQKTCPVMGGKINKSIYSVYEGKNVYFCCAGCKPKFEKDPEKYTAKLPQFDHHAAD